MEKSEEEVSIFLFNAPEKYKVYKIPKRKIGYRVIAQPSKELKEYQRAFLSIYSFPIHGSAMAYKKGTSIKENAQKHCSQKYLLKLDLQNFFNSITPDLFWDVWSSLKELPNEIEKRWIDNLLFWHSNNGLVLSVGAPSSPLISNFCMYFFDIELSKYCQKINISYTRYADDLTFSTNQKDILFEIPVIVKNFLQQFFQHKLNINHSKTAFSSKAHNRHITGITITNEGTLSLGRARKRYIKHLIHQFKLKKINISNIYHLQGLLSFAKHIEPAFINSLQNKYSVDLINSIFQIKSSQHDPQDL